MPEEIKENPTASPGASPDASNYQKHEPGRFDQARIEAMASRMRDAGYEEWEIAEEISLLESALVENARTTERILAANDQGEKVELGSPDETLRFEVEMHQNGNTHLLCLGAKAHGKGTEEAFEEMGIAPKTACTIRVKDVVDEDCAMLLEAARTPEAASIMAAMLTRMDGPQRARFAALGNRGALAMLMRSHLLEEAAEREEGDLLERIQECENEDLSDPKALTDHVRERTRALDLQESRDPSLSYIR